MTTDLERAVELLNPRTGELVLLDAPSQDLAEWLDAVREWEANLRDAKKLAQAELIRRMDADAKWTLHLEGLNVKAPSPEPRTEYDPELLAPTLAELVDEGAITDAAKDEALELVQSWKPKPRGIKALLKRGGDIAERVRACGREAEQVRRVSVSRKLP